jgi:segregation and condensation protein B
MSGPTTDAAAVRGDGAPLATPGRSAEPEPPVTGDVPAALEALLLMATEPLPAVELAQAVGVPVAAVESALLSLAAFYDETGRGFELRHVGSGWRYYTRPEHAPVVNRYVLEGQHGRLTQAALETLAVVAYLQPATRSRISAVRGVNVDGVVRTLLARDLSSGQVATSVSAALFETLLLSAWDSRHATSCPSRPICPTRRPSSQLARAAR